MVGRSFEGIFAGQVVWPPQKTLQPSQLNKLLEKEVVCPTACRRLCKSARMVIELLKKTGNTDAGVCGKKGIVVIDMSLSSYMQRHKKVFFKNGVVPCLHRSSQCIYIVNRKRYLTWRECLRLQGFEDDFHHPYDVVLFKKSHWYKAAGNSISVHLLESILLLNMHKQCTQTVSLKKKQSLAQGTHV